MSTISYKPLNLYRQFKTAAQEFPNVAIYFDQPYVSFPELGLENTYQTVLRLFKKSCSICSSRYWLWRQGGSV